MKKKNILMIALSLCLVAVIAVGGTLAYFTDTTEVKQNVFVSGNVNIAMTDETKDVAGEKKGEVEVDENGNQTGILYTNVMPGDTLSKVVAVTVLDEDTNTGRPASSNAHVGILVTIDEAKNPSSDELYALVDEAVGRLEAKEGDIWGDPQTVNIVKDDTLVTGKFYTYNPYVDEKDWENGVPAGETLTLFENIKIPTSWDNDYANQTFDISVQAYAIQADNMAASLLASAVQGTYKVDGQPIQFEQVAD